MKSRLGVALITALVMLTGCGGGSSSSQKALAVGSWGEDDTVQAQLTVTSTGATFGVRSGSGGISEPITVQGNGHFDLAGTLGGQAGGPPPGPDIPPPSYYPARYEGVVNGDTLSLTIYVTPVGSASYKVGPFTLTYGKSVTIPLPD
jgi:hypothetical protein